jgi:predicted nuclease of predicted toxin-antitoxin system
VSSAQRYLTDEDFDNDVLRGLVRRLPELDVLRVQDVGLAGAADPVILEWTAQQGRILLTHDAKTMPAHAYARLRAGQHV